MTVKQLIAKLKKVKNKDQHVYFPDRARVIGNITEVDVVEQDHYSFFGKKEPFIKLRAHTPEEDADN